MSACQHRWVAANLLCELCGIGAVEVKGGFPGELAEAGRLREEHELRLHPTPAEWDAMKARAERAEARLAHAEAEVLKANRQLARLEEVERAASLIVEEFYDRLVESNGATRRRDSLQEALARAREG